MKEKGTSFLELAENIFYDFSQLKLGSLNLHFSKKILFPVISYSSEMEILIPLPRRHDDKYLFEGILFDSDSGGRRNMWCLFLASVYHIAAHACVSRYSVYKSWKSTKTNDVCLRVIDYIEDISVDRYISHTDTEIWENMKKIESELILLLGKNSKLTCDENSSIFGLSTKKKLVNIRKSMLAQQNDAIFFANLLYKNRGLLPTETLPYCERHNVKQILKTIHTSPDFEPNGKFQENIVKLDELWLVEEQFKLKMLRKYEKNLKGLNFNSVIIPQGNFHKFLEIKRKYLPLIKRMHQQIRMVENIHDESQMDEMGYLNMQLAIQSIASESQSIDVFERDEMRRVEEAWVILIDNSASMSLRFEQMKEFAICIAEAANDLAGKPDAWALFGFDNDFLILKDFDEKYDHKVQARIGSLKNNGLSLLPDAIELTRRMLLTDTRERKYIFLITDGHTSGYDKINLHLAKIAKKLDASGISLIAIGVSKSTAKRFRNSIRGTDNLGQLVAKFISAYKTVSAD